MLSVQILSYIPIKLKSFARKLSIPLANAMEYKGSNK